MNRSGRSRGQNDERVDINKRRSRRSLKEDPEPMSIDSSNGHRNGKIHEKEEEEIIILDSEDEEETPKKRPKGKILGTPPSASTPISEDEEIFLTLTSFYKERGLKMEEILIALRNDRTYCTGARSQGKLDESSEEQLFWDNDTIPIPPDIKKEDAIRVLENMDRKRRKTIKEPFESPTVVAIERNKKFVGNSKSKLRYAERRRQKKHSETTSSNGSTPKKSQEVEDHGDSGEGTQPMAVDGDAHHVHGEFPDDDDDSQLLLSTQEAEELFLKSNPKNNSKSPIASTSNSKPASAFNTPVSTLKGMNLRSSSRASNSYVPSPAPFRSPNTPLPKGTSADVQPQKLFKNSTPIRGSSAANDTFDEDMDVLMSQIPMP